MFSIHELRGQLCYLLIVSFSFLEITLWVSTENLSISVNNRHYSPWFQRMISKYCINFHTKILWSTNFCEIKSQPSCFANNNNYFSVFKHFLLFITSESLNTVNLWMSAQGAYFKFRRRREHWFERVLLRRGCLFNFSQIVASLDNFSNTLSVYKHQHKLFTDIKSWF